MKILSKLLWVITLLMLGTSGARAAEIRGQATDRSGAAVSAAKVTLQNMATGAEESTQTDTSGRYSFANLPLGIYRLIVQQSGFSEDARTLSLADDNEILEANFIISPGGLTSSVTVTASRNARDTLDVPVRTESLSQANLEIKNPNSTGDALLQAGNITPVGNGPYGVRPRLRGLDSTRVLVLVDGERLNNARTATDRAGVEVGLVDPFTIERAEVASGAGSVLYGTDALAGTINLITRQPQPTTKAFRLSGGFDGYFSSNETGRRGTGTIAAAGRQFALSFTGGLERFDNYHSGKPYDESSQPLHDAGIIRQGDTIDDNFGFKFKAFPEPFNAPYARTSDLIPSSSAHGSNLNFSGLYLPTSNQSVSLKYLRRHVADTGFPDFKAPMFFQEISLPYSNLDKISAQYQIRQLTPWFSSFSAKLYYQKQDRLLRNDFPVQFPAPTAQKFFPISVFRLQILSDTEQQVNTTGMDLQANFRPSTRHAVTAGMTLFRDSSKDYRLNVTRTFLLGNVDLGSRGPQANVLPQPLPLGGPSVSYPVRVPNSTFRDFAVFVQDEWDLSRLVRLVGSLRADGYRVESKPTPGYTVDPLVQGANPPIDPATLPDVQGQVISRQALTGDIGLILRPTERLSFSARFGRSYRHPNLEELLYAGPATVGSIVPNITVEPERGYNLDFNLKLHTRRFVGSIGYFRNTYKGFISTEIVSKTSSTNSLSQAINFSDVRIQGLEANAEVPWVLGPAVLNLFCNLAYNHGQVIRGSNPLTGESLAGTPQDNISPFKALSGARLTDSKARYWAEYSNRIQTHVNRVASSLIHSPYLIAQDLYGLYGFTLHRLAWGMDWKREAHRIGFSVGIENLGDKYYREQFQFAPARGRSVTLGLHLHTF